MPLLWNGAPCDPCALSRDQATPDLLRAYHQFGEIRTARLTTAEGTRCLSGTGDAFLQTLRVLTLLSVGPGARAPLSGAPTVIGCGDCSGRGRRALP